MAFFMKAPSSPQEITQHLITILEEHGQGDYIGESISQLEHCLQAAHQAQEANSPNSTIIAALLHDIGQFLPSTLINSQIQDLKSGPDGASIGRVGHERIGEVYLRSLGFSSDVCRLVGSHVAAKRFLTAVDAGYYAELSAASQKSLELQGGPFVGEELKMFTADPLSKEMVRLRRWDDAAKVVGVQGETPRAGEYAGMIEEHLKEQLGIANHQEYR